MSLKQLKSIVPPPTHIVEPATQTTWDAVQEEIGIRLPKELFNLSAIYGSGIFNCSDGRYLQIFNPVSRKHRRSYASLQDSYRDLKQNDSSADFPYDLFPIVPGLLIVGGATSPMALFYYIQKRKVRYSVVVRTFQKKWVEIKSGLLSCLVSLLSDHDSCWPSRNPSAGVPKWTFVPEAATSTALVDQFHEAVLLGDAEAIHRIAKAGVDVNAKDSSGNTPLCRTEEPQVIRLLLSVGADVNAVCDDGRTPLAVSLMSQAPIDIIQLLIQRGANPNAQDGFGMTPLMHACKSSDIEVIKCLLKAGADVTLSDSIGQTALHSARKRPDVIKLLQQPGRIA